MDITTLNAYNQHSGSFAKDWHEQPLPADLHSVVRQYFRPGFTADVGCGSGRETAWLSENGYPAIGFDPSEGLLKEAEHRYPGVRFQQGALPDLDRVENGSFRNVLCETVIMHLNVATIAPSVRRLMTLLEPGGILYLSWRITEGADRRDERGRLYAAFDSSLVVQVLSSERILLDERRIGTSSGKNVHRIVAEKR